MKQKTIAEMIKEFDDEYLISEIILLGEDGEVRRIIIDNFNEDEKDEE